MKKEHSDCLKTAVRKSAGMIKRVEKLVEDGAYCVDIVQQVNATIGLLKSINTKLLESHIKCCWSKKLLSKDPKEVDAFVKELVRTRDVSTRK